MTLQNWIISIALVFVALIAIYGVSHPTATQTVREIVNNVGAVPTLTSPQEWNGVVHINESRRFAAGTSTVFSFRAAATTTVENFACKTNGGLGFAQQYEFAISATNPTATSTQSLGKFDAASSGSSAALATTTSLVLGTGQFLNVKMATTSATTVNTALAPVGNCSLHGIQI